MVLVTLAVLVGLALAVMIVALILVTRHPSGDPKETEQTADLKTSDTKISDTETQAVHALVAMVQEANRAQFARTRDHYSRQEELLTTIVLETNYDATLPTIAEPAQGNRE